MRNLAKRFSLSLAVASLALTGLTAAGNTSGHFISGLQGQYPAYDLNDTYVFESSNEGYTTFILSANPSAPGTGVSPARVVFGDDGLYNIHISHDGEFGSGMTLVFSFEGKTVEVHKIDTPNAAVGKTGELLGSGTVGETVTLPNGIRIWTGRGEDPFFGNGIGLAKFNAAKQSGIFTPEVFQEDGDLFIGATASFIVVDIPNEMLGDQVKVFTTTSVLHRGEWRQVSRHANALFPYMFLSDTPAVQEDHEQHRPDLDVTERRQAIVHNVFWAVSVSKAEQDRAMKYANDIADLVMPDVLTYQPGSQANYAVTGLNGRALHDDAMNTVLQLMMGVAVDDNADDTKCYMEQFPYINPVN